MRAGDKAESEELARLRARVLQLEDRLELIEGRSERASESEADLLLHETERLANIGSWTWDLATSDVFWSPELFRILGYDAAVDKATVEGFFAALHPEDRDRVRRASAESARSGVTSPTRTRMLHRDGTVREVIVDGVTIYDGGRPIRMVGTVLDMTDRLTAMRALQRSEILLNEAQRVAHVGSWYWDHVTDVVEWSDEFYRIFGVARSPLWNTHSFFDLVHEEDRDRLRAESRQASTTGATVSTEFRIRRHGDGAIRHLLCHAQTLRDSDGRMVAFVGTILDVTDRMELEQQLRQAQKMDALGRLAGGVAHEFNNLLTVILGHAQLLLAREQGRDELRAIVHAAQAAAELTRNLLSFSRQAPRAAVSMDVDETVGVVAKLAARVIGERIRMVAERSDRPCRVRADPNQIQQVLLNLALNARDAMPDGGVLRMRTALHELDPERAGRIPNAVAGPCVLVEVSDTGIGMDEQTKARIFEPFFTTKAAGKGTGLGLAIVYGAVRQSAGAIEVESSPGRGSTFRIFLPLDQRSTPLHLETSGPAPGRGTGRVLVVEDDTEVASLVANVLGGAGYTVRVAHDVSQADQLWRLHGESTDLLITDVVMPQRGGAQTARLFREARPNLRVLFMSGYAPEEAGEVAPQGWLEKPFSPDELLARVREALA